MLEAELAAKKSPTHKTVIDIGGGIKIGGRELMIAAGPCTVENLEQMEEVCRVLTRGPVQAIRGGLFKPRTSPYAFQGLGGDGLDIVERTKELSGVPFISEIMSAEHIDVVIDHVDVLQIGSRNMQNFDLLKAVGKTRKPVLLKRGLSATLDEMLMAAEYILAGGNERVILCERGIRSFDRWTRNVLDLGAVVMLKQLTHLPVIVDPSHAAGKRELVADLARAAVACGADGLIVEAHPEPEKSVSDARQALSLEDMNRLIESLAPIAEAVGRSIGSGAPGQVTLPETAVA
ncbi:MAG: 3-deoxy-7-phosphoheptulonate synthase [Candidatus Melainabacteria bacterium]|nr:3-deoxy-7-phosphoheptulonate synthase [Candidatus Melainabacteria bacterium]